MSLGVMTSESIKRSDHVTTTTTANTSSLVIPATHVHTIQNACQNH